jgi:hypothetical protein
VTKRHEVVSVRKKKVRRHPAGEVTLKITLKAQGLTPGDVVEYVTRAIDGWSGQFEADDPRQKIRVAEIQRLGWIKIQE